MELEKAENFKNQWMKSNQACRPEAKKNNNNDIIDIKVADPDSDSEY